MIGKLPSTSALSLVGWCTRDEASGQGREDVRRCHRRLEFNVEVLRLLSHVSLNFPPCSDTVAEPPHGPLASLSFFKNELTLMRHRSTCLRATTMEARKTLIHSQPPTTSQRMSKTSLPLRQNPHHGLKGWGQDCWRRDRPLFSC